MANFAVFLPVNKSYSLSNMQGGVLLLNYYFSVSNIIQHEAGTQV